MDLALYLMMGGAIFSSFLFIALTAYMNHRGKSRRDRIKKLIEDQNSLKFYSKHHALKA